MKRCLDLIIELHGSIRPVAAIAGLDQADNSLKDNET